MAAEIPKMFGGLLATLNRSYDLILSNHEVGVQGMEEEKVTELLDAASSDIDASVVKTEGILQNVPQEPSLISSAGAEGEGESKYSTQQTALTVPLPTIPTPDPSTAPAPSPGSPNAFCTLRAGLETVNTLFSFSLSAIYLCLYLSIYLSICLSIYLSIYQSLYLSLYPSLSLSHPLFLSLCCTLSLSIPIPI